MFAGLSKHIDLRLMSRLEFGSGAVAMRYELDVNRETVARHLKQAKSASEPANAPAGSDTPEPASKPANAPTGSDGLETGPFPSDQTAASPSITVDHDIGRRSECEPWRKVIQAMCDQGLRPTHLPGSHHRT